MLINFIKKIGSFAILLAVFQFVVMPFIFEATKENKPIDPRLFRKVMDLPNTIDIVFFGDSVIKSISPEDEDQRSITVMLDDQLPSKRQVFDLSANGNHVGVFHSEFRHLVNKKKVPKVVVVPINLRSFSPLWEGHPAWQFNDFIFSMNLANTRYFKALYMPLQAFGAIPLWSRLADIPELRNTTYGEYGAQDIELLHGDSELLKPVFRSYPRIEHLEKSQKMAQTVAELSYLVTSAHADRREDAFTRLSTDLRKAGVKGIFYVTPIDYTTLSEVLGDEAIQQIRNRVSSVKKLVEGNGHVFMDLSMILGKESFDWHGINIHEHMRDSGRAYVAEKVAKAIQLSTDEE